MRHILIPSLAAATLLAGCASSPTGPSQALRPVCVVSPAVVNQVDPADPTAKQPPVPVGTVAWTGTVHVPGVYRAYMVGGKMVLQQETDPKVIAAAPSSMRILLGNPEAGEIAYQPLLLEQEHAIELARTRAMAARSEQLGTEMVGHVATLQQASDQMRAETAELAHRLEVQTAYIKMLEAKLAAMGADPVPAPASPKPPSPQPSPSSSSKPAVPTVTKS